MVRPGGSLGTVRGLGCGRVDMAYFLSAGASDEAEYPLQRM